jgi:hypothetical protein
MYVCFHRTLDDKEISCIIREEHMRRKTFEVKGEILAILQQVKRQTLFRSISISSSCNREYVE